MSGRPRLSEGCWFDVATAQQHETLLRYGKLAVKTTTDGAHARVQRGEFSGPGKYLLLSWEQPCPRNCCYDLVRELLPASEVVEAVREEMIALGSVLRTAKGHKAI